MIYAILVVLAAAIIAANICLYMYRQQTKYSRWRENYGRMTRTGETFEDRKAWHDRGELSPGEHAIAQAIRERVSTWKIEGEEKKKPEEE